MLDWKDWGGGGNGCTLKHFSNYVFLYEEFGGYVSAVSINVLPSFDVTLLRFGLLSDDTTLRT